MSDLLTRVHERLGLGIDIQTFTNGVVEAVWRRDYDGEWSVERFASSTSIDGVLLGILRHEDKADQGETT